METMKLSQIDTDLISAGWATAIKDANLFFYPNYYKSRISEGKQCVYVFSESYVIPVVLARKAIFRYAFFPSEPFQYKNDNRENLEEFLTCVCSYVRQHYNIQWFNATPPSALFMAFPAESKHIPFGSHVIDLSASEDELWAKVHSKHRNVIKKAEKDGVEIVCGVNDDLINDYHSLDVETWKRSNKGAAGLESLRKQIKELGDNVVLYLAYLNGEPQSGAIFYYNNAMCYYMHGANCDKPHTGAGNLLQWRAILDMKAAGVKRYSFVGCRINEDENSKFHGIQRFKERFGGDLVQGYMFKVIFSPAHYALYRFMIMALDAIQSRHFSLSKDIIDQEIRKWQ